ncbi:MAG: flavin reductase [Sphingomonadaceae bacterium PASS1]|nr:MAG: flavin reductase [Sphingomonadaceae bacterium PASS1]
MSDQQLFRSAISRLSAAVNVIATDGEVGLYGMTASAVCSVSDDPPMILVCVNRNVRANEIFKVNGRLSVNILADGQSDISARFASSALSIGERFGEMSDWFVGETSAPLLSDALAALDCTVESVTEIATHSVFFCKVERIELGELRDGLVYFDRNYRRTAMAISQDLTT